MLVLEIIIGLLAAIAGALIALALQARLAKTGAQQTGARIQESQLRISQTQQEKRIAELEARLTAQVQQSLQQQETVAQAHKQEVTQVKLEHELARLHRVEETPLTLGSGGQHRPTFANWQPAMLKGGNLHGRDLSHRYLGHANLREAELSNAALFMANLSEASLVKSNLAGADLSGADLSGADLSGANLANANLLVADLHHTVLIGTNLLGVRGLTPEQLQTATYDETTVFDAGGSTPRRVESIRKRAEMEGTAPRMPSILQAPASGATEVAAEPAKPVVTPPAPTSVAKPTTPVVTPPTSTNLAKPVVAEAARQPVAPVATPLPPKVAPAESPSFRGTADDASVPAPTSATSAPEWAVEKTPAGSPSFRGTADDARTLDLAPSELAQLHSTPAPTELSPARMESLPAPMIALPEVQSATLLPDMTPFIDQLADPPASSSLTSGDSLLDPAVTDLLVDTPGSTRTGRAGTAAPKRKYSGKGAAKAN